MTLYTIGFTQKTARQFFNLIKDNNIDILLDIRLNNKSQLAGFTKGEDLSYFLPTICGCEYRHCIEFAPSKEVLDGYKGKEISWEEYELKYRMLITSRGDYKNFAEKYKNFQNICLLCSEPAPLNCHRRLLAEILHEEFSSITIRHI